MNFLDRQGNVPVKTTSMTNVPLIPFKRPVPQVLLKSTPIAPVKPVPKKKGTTSMATKKPKTAAPKFEASNTEDITKKPVNVQKMWQILSKMDPDGDLFVDDKAIVILEGEGPSSRTPKDLKLTDEELALIRPYGVYDGPDPDTQETATGIIFTVFYMVEAAYALGARDEAAKITKSLTSAAVGLGEEDEEEDFDDDEVTPVLAGEVMDEIDEDDDEDDDGDDDDDKDDDDDDEDEDD